MVNRFLSWLLGASLLTTVAGAAPYQRWYFGDWSDDNHDGCNRRCEILTQRSLIPVTYTTPKHSYVRTGYWTNAYDFSTPIHDAADLDLDHVIPLALAWQWGADGWDKARLNQFYNDSGNLASTTEHINRSKGDKPPSKWAPQGEVERCFYFWRFRDVATRYELSVPASEMNVLNSCDPNAVPATGPLFAPETKELPPAPKVSRRKRKHTPNPVGCLVRHINRLVRQDGYTIFMT